MKIQVKKMCKKVVNFVRENKLFTLRLALMAACAFSFSPDTITYAATATTTGATSGTGHISAIEQPLQTMRTVMEGPVPRAIVTMGAVVGGASWAMNIDNQVTKTAMRVIGGGSVALGAATFISDSTGFLIP